MIRFSPWIVSFHNWPKCFCWAASAALVGYGHVTAGPTTTVGIAEKEVQRRAAMIENQTNRLSEAAALAKSGNVEGAYALYQEIYQNVPDIPLAQEVRAVAREGYVRSGLKRASELMAAANYPEALKILDTLDSPAVAKGRREIAELRARYTDPDRYPAALTPKHIKDVGEVQRLLTMAASQQETGMYDQALTTYEQVLRIDTTNSAARRGLERVEADRARYFEAAKDHSRARMLSGVSELWEDKPRLKPEDVSALFNAERAQLADSGQKSGRASITAKLRDLRIERVDFTSATLDEVLEYLKVRARDLDPTKKGVDFVNGVAGNEALSPITLNLVNVPIEEVLRYVAQVAGVNYRIEEYAVRIVPLTDTNQTIISKSYRVPPDFITSAPSAAPAAAAADPFSAQAPGAAAAAGTLVRRLGAKEYLESRGVVFPEGAGASYNPVANMLTVRNTAKNIELIDGLVEQTLNTAPKMAVVEVKIVEVNQTKLEEFGFDWLLDSFGTKMTFAGGTVGNAQSSNFRVNEFPENSALAANIGVGSSGLRSSGNLGNTAIEDVLYGSVTPTSKRSPGALTLTGVLTDPQFQVVWRALDQKTGIDLVSKPSVITKNGQKASIEIIREFIYPTEYDPPQIPTNITGSRVQTFINGILQPSPPLPPIPVTPTTPTAFETRRVGMILDVEPQISEDGKTIDLLVTPDLTEFLGFVNYGSPIYQVSGSSKEELTPNTITQPIFTTKKIVTGVKVYDGQTVVLGGLMSDQSIMINDKIPVVGDLPFLGKFFQSKVKQKRSKNLLFFVTVKVVDPSGNRINPDM